MSNVYHAGDYHLGHKNVHLFRKDLGFTCESEHAEFVMERLLQTVNKRDTLFLHGDIAFTAEGLNRLRGLKCQKLILVRGNHDKLATSLYLEVFDEVYGIITHKSAWLTHAPVHPLELRGRINIHGHVHYATIPDDDRYINVSLENIDYFPITRRHINYYLTHKAQGATIQLNEHKSWKGV